MEADLPSGRALTRGSAAILVTGRSGAPRVRAICRVRGSAGSIGGAPHVRKAAVGTPATPSTHAPLVDDTSLAEPSFAGARLVGPRPRVAIGAIFTECNHLGGAPIDRSWYERYELLRGEELLTGATGAVAGMLEVLRERHLTPVPLLYASTCSGGPLTRATYEELKGEILARLRAALPVNGVLLPLHGAAAAEHVGDPEGDLIGAVRALVGTQTPVVATLDLHAHVTARMVLGADALLAWETYPHRDAVSTGKRAARLLADTVAGRCRPTMAMAKVPVVTGAINGSTEGAGPFADLMRRAKALEADAGVLSTSMFLVHPYLDLPDLGSGALVVTDGDPQRAGRLATALAKEYWQRRAELEPEVHTPEQAVAAGLQVEGTVLLVETADCCGGGAAGDSAASLKALLGAALPGPALVPVVGPGRGARLLRRRHREHRHRGGGTSARSAVGTAGHRDRPRAPPQRRTLPLPRRHLGRSGRRHGHHRRARSSLPRRGRRVHPAGPPRPLRLGRRAVPLRRRRPGHRQVHRRQEPDELPSGLFAHRRRHLHPGHPRAHTGHGPQRLLPQPAAPLVPRRPRHPQPPSHPPRLRHSRRAIAGR